jgi:hypothetical protein
MLTISNAQLEIFQEALDRKFCTQHIEMIRQRYSDRTTDLDNEMLLCQMSQAVKQARKYKLTDDKNSLGFIMLRFWMGFDFDQQPLFANILRNEAIGADAKMRALLHGISAAEWHSAQVLGKKPGDQK